MILKFLTSIEKSPTIRCNRSQDWSSLPTCFEAFSCHSLFFQCSCGTGFIVHQADTGQFRQTSTRRYPRPPAYRRRL